MVVVLDKNIVKFDKMPLLVLVLLGVGFSLMGVGEYSRLHRFSALLVGIGYFIMVFGIGIVLAGRYRASRK